MKLEYENKKPVLKLEENEMSVTIVFSDNPQNTNLKQTILDLLTSAFDNRVSFKNEVNHYSQIASMRNSNWSFTKTNLCSFYSFCKCFMEIFHVLRGKSFASLS